MKFSFGGRYFVLVLVVAFLASCAHRAQRGATENIDSLWRGIHLPAPESRENVARMERLVPELARFGVNRIVLEVNGAYRYASHPEIGTNQDAMNATDAHRLVGVCCANGIELIPQFQCIGHQSGGFGAPPGALLTAYPEFDETPGRAHTEPGLYCKEYCPSNPTALAVVLDLIDELARDFDARTIHTGMDEVFLLGDPACTHCAGKAKQDIFADHIVAIHDHLAQRNIRMMMWADRLIDPAVTRYGNWEESGNGLWPAIDRLPRDIVLCPWHYEKHEAYPSLAWLMQKGFDVWPSTWRDRRAGVALIRAARQAAQNPELAPHWKGALFTTWTESRVYSLLSDGTEPEDPIFAEAFDTLQDGMRELGAPMPPYPPVLAGIPDFIAGGAATIRFAPSPGVEIRYTMDGSDPTGQSPLYTVPFEVRSEGILKARAFGARGRSKLFSTPIRALEAQNGLNDAERLEQGLLCELYEGAWRSGPAD